MNSLFAFRLSAVPDIDSDGVDDLVVGAPNNRRRDPPNNFIAGTAFVFSGRTGELRHHLVSPKALPSGYFGIVAGLPDIDADGHGDLLVGALGESAVYAFSGATGAHLYTLRSPGGGARFGASVVALPDLDADGVADVGIGADAENSESGRAYIFSGATGALLHTLAPPDPGAYGYFGYAMCAVPDLDQDGVHDLAVGKPQERHSSAPNDTGRVYLFSGATGAYIAAIDAPQHPAGHFGAYLAGLPDVDADGRGDIAISAPWQRLPNGVNYGSVHVYSGGSRSLMHSAQLPYTPRGGFGIGLSTGPDLDGDGFAEFAACGQNEMVDGHPSAGRAYVFSSRDGRLVREFQSPNPMEGGGFGAAIEFRRHTGPGPAAIAIGAANEQDGDPLLLGRVYVFESCPADFDYNGITNSADFFAFLAAFFEERAAGDFDRSGRVDSRDFFDFLTWFFTGC